MPILPVQSGDEEVADRRRDFDGNAVRGSWFRPERFKIDGRHRISGSRLSMRQDQAWALCLGNGPLYSGDIGFPTTGGSGFRYAIRQQIQIPSLASGYFSATTEATAKRHKVVIDRKRMILRTVNET